MQTQPIDKPVRVGVFSSVQAADSAVAALARSGYTREEISVLAPESLEAHFAPVAEQTPREKSKEGVVAGSTIGAVLGSLALIAGVATSGGIPILAVGALGLGFGGVVGGLIGAMSMRGVEREYADFYDQSLTKGKILVAIESHDPARLSRAEHILIEEGAEPIPLPEG
jgi:hypothetical protein